MVNACNDFERVTRFERKRKKERLRKTVYISSSPASFVRGIN